MTRLPQVFRPETRAFDCFDWISADDVCRHALAAFYAAVKDSSPPKGERFLDAQGQAWSGRCTFADNLAAIFEQRIKTEAYQLGFAPDFINEARCLSNRLKDLDPIYNKTPERAGRPGPLAQDAAASEAAVQAGSGTPKAARAAQPTSPRLCDLPRLVHRLDSGARA